MRDLSNVKDLWVFGYGSLMWRPDFEYEIKAKAICVGYHRSFCIYSFLYRGTEAHPGLVLGLDEGGECVGIAFKVKEKDRDQVIDYLREREQVNQVYDEVVHPIHVEGEGDVPALFYVASHSHKQYTGALSQDAQVEIIKTAHGSAGSCKDYLLNTHATMVELGIEDEELNQLCVKVCE